MRCQARRQRRAPGERLRGTALLVGVLLFGGPAHGKTLVAFGASMTDNGTGFFPAYRQALLDSLKALPSEEAAAIADELAQPSPPYVGGRFTNGPTYTEYLARRTGHTLESYAVGGAVSGGNTLSDPFYPKMVNTVTQQALEARLPGQGVKWVGTPVSTLGDQVKQYLSNHGGTVVEPDAVHIIPSDLVVNDLFSYVTSEKSVPARDKQFVNGVVEAQHQALQVLHKAGARRFFLYLAPDLSVSPMVLQAGNETAARCLKLQESIERKQMELAAVFQATHWVSVMGVYDFRLSSSLASLITTKALAGVVNTKQPCYMTRTIGFSDPGVQPCDDPDRYYFWDSLHFTARAAELLAFSMMTKLPPLLWE